MTLPTTTIFHNLNTNIIILRVVLTTNQHLRLPLFISSSLNVHSWRRENENGRYGTIARNRLCTALLDRGANPPMKSVEKARVDTSEERKRDVRRERASDDD